MSKYFLYIISTFNEKELYPLTLREKCKGSLILNHNLFPFNKLTNIDIVPTVGDKIIVLSKINKIFHDNNGFEISLYSLLCGITLKEELYGNTSSNVLSPEYPLEFMLSSQHYSHLYSIDNIKYGITNKLITINDIKKLLSSNILRNLDIQPQIIQNVKFLSDLFKTNFALSDLKPSENDFTINSFSNFKNAISNPYYIVKEKNNKFSNNKIKKHNIKSEKINYAKTVLDRATLAASKNKDFIPYRRKIVASKCDEKNEKVLYNFLFENEVKDMDSFFYYIGNDFFIDKIFPTKDFPRYRYEIIPLLSNVYFESDKIRNLQSNLTLDFADSNQNLSGSTSGRPDGLYVLYDKLYKSFSIYILELKKHYSQDGDISEFEALQKKNNSKKSLSVDDCDDDTNFTNDDWLFYEKLAFNDGSQGIYEDSHTKQADLFFSRLNSNSYYYDLNTSKSKTTLINSISGEQEFLSKEQLDLLRKNTIIKLTSITTSLLLGEMTNNTYKYEYKFKDIKNNLEPIKVTLFKKILTSFKNNINYVFIIDKITNTHKTDMVKVIQHHNANPLIYLIDRFIITDKKENCSYIKTVFKDISNIK